MATAIESIAHSGLDIPLFKALPQREQTSRVISSKIIDFSPFHNSFVRIFGDSSLTFDTYNPSNLFHDQHGSYQAIRVDASDGRTKTVIFQQINHGLMLIPNINFDLEDPFAGNMKNGEIIFGGVDVKHLTNGYGERVSTWRTVLYRGKTITRLEPFFIGPVDMKDIRLAQMKDGRICVYTRPRNPEDEREGGDGKVGYTEFGSIDELRRSSPQSLSIHNAPLLPFEYGENEWRGINQVLIMEEGEYKNWNFLLGHKAHKEYTEGGMLRHYAGTGHFHNPDRGVLIDKGVLVKASDCPTGPCKSPDLEDEFFPGGIIFNKDKTAIVIGGLRDKQVAGVTINANFLF